MSMRRAAAVAAVLAGAAASVILGPAPASADDVEVRLRLSDTFTAGGPPGPVGVRVTRDGIEGCARVAVTLTVELDDLRPGQVQVAVFRGGWWRAVDLTQEADGRFATGHIPPEQPVICRNRSRSTSLRFQVVFLAGVQAGEAKFEAVASSGTGDKLGDDSDTANVVAGRAATASPTPAPPATGTAPADVATTAVAPEAPPASGDGEGGGFGAGTVAMILGLVMVGGGVALLVVMILRIRGGGADQEDGPGNGPWPPPGAGDPWPRPGNGPRPDPGGGTPGYGPGGTAVPPQPGGLPPATAGGDSNPTQILPAVPNPPQ